MEGQEEQNIDYDPVLDLTFVLEPTFWKEVGFKLVSISWPDADYDSVQLEKEKVWEKIRQAEYAPRSSC
jgi:hypothetical protein